MHGFVNCVACKWRFPSFATLILNKKRSTCAVLRHDRVSQLINKSPTQKTFCSALSTIKQKSYMEYADSGAFPFLAPPLPSFPSIARWKARGRLPIRHNWTSFAISYGWETLGPTSENLSKSAFSEGADHFERKFQTEESVVRQPLLVSENYCDYPFVWCQIYLQCIVWFYHKARVTDRQNNDS